MKSSASRRAPSVSFHSGELGLADWLKLSWFYPEGFKGEELLESPRAWLVLGNGIAYKFLKSNDRPGNPARDRWRKSCQELIENAPLAGPVYLGLRCLLEDEDQLVWESRSRSMEEKPHQMPKNVQDVALVMRRLNIEDRLDRLTRPSEPSGKTVFARIASALARFHETRSQEQRRTVQPSPHQFFSLTEERHLKSMRAKLLRSEGALDRTTTRGFEELINYLSKFLSRALPYFRDRHLGGHIHECHRNVQTRTIFLLRELEGPRHPVIISRRLPDSGQHIDDCLFDVATLSIDLESRGNRLSAERFEEEYFALRPRSLQQESFEFFKAAAACEQLLAAYSGDARDEDSMERADTLLSLALRLANGLNRPAIIFYQHETSKSRESGEKLAALLGAEHVTEETGLPEYLEVTLPEEFLIRRVLLRCRELLQNGKVVVFALKGMHWISAEELDKFLERTPCFRALVRPPGAPAESLLPEGPDSAPEKRLHVGNLAFLSDCFPPLEQAFLALRELGWLASSMRRE